MARHTFTFVITAAVVLMIGEELFAGGLALQLRNCPLSVKAGRDLDSSFQVAVVNKGDAAMKEATVEIVLKKAGDCPIPARHAVYSSNFFDGVLLAGGRESLSLGPGQTVTLRPHGKNTIPWDTPVGRTYFLCAVVVPNDPAKGSDGASNCACSPIRVSGVEERPVITGYAEQCIKRAGTVTILGRNFGTGEGKAVLLAGNGIPVNLPLISWQDSMITARIPDDLGIRDGQRYFIAVRDAQTAEWLSNTDKYIGICPAPEATPPPRPESPPAPPFFH